MLWFICCEGSERGAGIEGDPACTPDPTLLERGAKACAGLAVVGMLMELVPDLRGFLDPVALLLAVSAPLAVSSFSRLRLKRVSVIGRT